MDFEVIGRGVGWSCDDINHERVCLWFNNHWDMNDLLTVQYEMYMYLDSLPASHRVTLIIDNHKMRVNGKHEANTKSMVENRHPRLWLTILISNIYIMEAFHEYMTDDFTTDALKTGMKPFPYAFAYDLEQAYRIEKMYRAGQDISRYHELPTRPDDPQYLTAVEDTWEDD